MTIQYPDEKNEARRRAGAGASSCRRDPDGGERCVACYLCAVACPVDCIALQATEDENGRRYPEFFRINFSRCIFCGFCEEACPTYAIQLTPDFEMGEYDRQNLVYEKEDLLIDGPGKYPDYNFYRVAGLAIGGKDKGEAENEIRRRSTRGACCPEPSMILFYIAVAVAVVATPPGRSPARNAVHALLYLIVSLLASRWCSSLLGAPFVAALEVIIYAGAIMVLFVFVVMMLDLRRRRHRRASGRGSPPASGAGPAALAAVLLGELLWTLQAAPASAGGREVGRERGRHRRSSAPTCSASSSPRSCCSALWSAPITSAGGIGDAW